VAVRHIHPKVHGFAQNGAEEVSPAVGEGATGLFWREMLPWEKTLLWEDTSIAEHLRHR
jgi:hypothetical protein